MATLFHPDGSAEEVHPAGGENLTIDDFHRLLPDADALDFVYLRSGMALIVDDLGMRKKLPINLEATRLYHSDGGTTPIYGSAIYCRLRYPGTAHEKWD